jgi:hypothetical protein
MHGRAARLWPDADALARLVSGILALATAAAGWPGH